MNAEHETPIEVPIRTDELGIPYIPLRPVPGMRSVAISASDALTLWAANGRIAKRAVAMGDVNAWTAATKSSDFFLSVAIELDPKLEVLLAFPPPVEGQGEA